MMRIGGWRRQPALLDAIRVNEPRAVGCRLEARDGSVVAISSGVRVIRWVLSKMRNDERPCVAAVTFMGGVTGRLPVPAKCHFVTRNFT